MTLKNLRKHFLDLTRADFESHPIWENDLSDEAGDEDERYFMPVKKLPADDLDGCLAGVQVRLANGKRVWCRMENVDLHNLRRTEQLLYASFEKEGKWFGLSRYWDPWYKKKNPAALAEFLGLPLDEVFPITYDLRPHVIGTAPSATGVITKEPRERLSEEQVMKIISGK